MLGHVLRSGDDTPAFLSFRFACLGCFDYKGRRGRPRSNLFDLLLKDIMTNNIIVIVNKRFSLSNFNDLVYKAHDRRLWRSYGWVRVETTRPLDLWFIFYYLVFAVRVHDWHNDRTGIMTISPEFNYFFVAFNPRTILQFCIHFKHL